MVMPMLAFWVWLLEAQALHVCPWILIREYVCIDRLGAFACGFRLKASRITDEHLGRTESCACWAPTNHGTSDHIIQYVIQQGKDSAWTWYCMDPTDFIKA